VLGAVPRDDVVDFEVWAPGASLVGVRLNDADHSLVRGVDGLWHASVEARHGDDYVYVLDGAAWPDPCSRWQPNGVRGPSRILDASRLSPKPRGATLEELVLYELHVGTFSDEGTFDGAIPHLAPLAELGVTAVEVMPIGTFPGDRGWGYDGLYTWAPHEVYGGPEGFGRFVEAAHEAGLGVVLDVVYNHVGPGDEALRGFGPWFTDRHETGWGDALDYSRWGVREWAIQNAELWVRDYGVDGLRLDAVHAVFDDGPKHVLAELAERVRALEPATLVISEVETGNARPIERWGHDAQWADEFHHELHVLLTGEREAYYAGYGAVEGLAAQLRRTPPEPLVFCSQNHDQVGNRAAGDRPGTDELRVRAALLLFAPQTPLLFMGEEYGERNPFQFFTDHIDPFIADATREGRRREFAEFAGFSAEDVPDPQARETFERSTLDRSRADEQLRGFYRQLLELRRTLPRQIEVDVDGRRLHMRRGGAELRIDLDARTAELHR
jgi:maltooligosyltrehalose trehalohydrolase